MFKFTVARKSIVGEIQSIFNRNQCIREFRVRATKFIVQISLMFKLVTTLTNKTKLLGLKVTLMWAVLYSSLTYWPMDLFRQWNWLLVKLIVSEMWPYTLSSKTVALIRHNSINARCAQLSSHSKVTCWASESCLNVTRVAPSALQASCAWLEFSLYFPSGERRWKTPPVLAET